MDTKNVEEREPQAQDEQDTEGHNMWLNPTLSGDLARSRSRDIEKQARERQRAKEAKAKR